MSGSEGSCSVIIIMRNVAVQVIDLVVIVSGWQWVVTLNEAQILLMVPGWHQTQEIS